VGGVRGGCGWGGGGVGEEGDTREVLLERENEALRHQVCE